MSLNRYAKKRDIAEKGIISALEAVGVEVWILDKPVDLLTLFRGRWLPMEIKTGNAKVRKGQQAEAVSKGIPIVRTPLEALECVGAITREGEVIRANVPARL